MTRQPPRAHQDPTDPGNSGALPECSRIEGLTRGRRRQRWMGERTRVVVMSRAQANCCRLLSTSLCKSTEVHGTGGRESVAFLRRWLLLSTARLQEVVTRSFLSRVPRSPLCFSCAHRRVAVARAVVREAKRQERRRRSVRGWWEDAGTTKRGATAPRSCFLFSIPARLCAFSDSGRWQLRVAAGYGHRARRPRVHVSAFPRFGG